jgi:hypothetical protein
MEEQQNNGRRILLFVALSIAVGIMMVAISKKSRTYTSSPSTYSSHGDSYSSPGNGTSGGGRTSYDSSKDYSSSSSPVQNPSYERTRPDYDPDAPLLPRHQGDIEPLYNEVQRRKEEQGISDREAVNQILEEYEAAGGR